GVGDLAFCRFLVDRGRHRRVDVGETKAGSDSVEFAHSATIASAAWRGQVVREPCSRGQRASGTSTIVGPAHADNAGSNSPRVVTRRYSHPYAAASVSIDTVCG